MKIKQKKYFIVISNISTNLTQKHQQQQKSRTALAILLN